LHLAGDAAYKRCEACLREERVDVLRIEGDTITVDVTGADIYRVTLSQTAWGF
jgi:hypothetical protein